MEGGPPPASGRISRVPPYSGSAAMQPQAFRVRGGFHPLWPAFPGPFRYTCGFLLHGLPPPPHPPYNPPAHPRHAVWALPPRSLAATRGGISFDFYSRRYLDGSLPPGVSPMHAMYSRACACHPDLRVTPPFGHPRISGYWPPLPAAFRSLSRPSSPGSS